MAFRRLIENGLARKLMERVAAKDQEAADELQLATNLRAQGKRAEANEAAQRAEKLSRAADKEYARAEDFPNALYTQLLQDFEKLGIEDLTIEEALAILSTTEGSTKEGTTSKERGNPDLTDKQHLAALIRLRIYPIREWSGAHMNDLISHYFSEAEIEARKMETIRATIISTWESTQLKFEKVLSLIGSDLYKTMLPVPNERLKLLADFPNIQDIIQQLNQVPLYQGWSIAELFDKTKSIKALAGRPEMPTTPTQKEHAPNQATLTEKEVSYLASKLLEKIDDLESEYIVKLETYTNNHPVTEDESPELVQSLLNKLSHIYQASNEHRSELTESQNEIGFISLMLLTEQFHTEDELLDLLV